MSFQKVFERLSEVHDTARLSSEARSSNVVGKEGPRRKVRAIQWKPASEFNLLDKSNDDGIKVLSKDPPSKEANDKDNE